MKLRFLYLLSVILLMASCVDRDMLVDHQQDISDSEFVDLNFTVDQGDAQSKVALTEDESSVSHLYAFVVGSDSTVLQVIDKPIASPADLNFTCKSIERSKFPVTLRVLANLDPRRKDAFLSKYAFRLADGTNYHLLNPTEIAEVKTSQAISSWFIKHVEAQFDGSFLPKMGNKVVAIENAGKPQSIQIKNVVARIDVKSDVALSHAAITPRVEYWRLDGIASVPYEMKSSVTRLFPVGSRSDGSVYILPGTGGAATENTGVIGVRNDGQGELRLLLPNEIRPNTRYLCNLSATGVVVSAPGVADASSGVTLTKADGTLELSVESVSPTSVVVGASGDDDGSWLKKAEVVPSKASGLYTHRFTYTENQLIRKANITVSNANGSFQQIPVTYSPRDGEVRMLKTSSLAKPLCIVIVGDGFRPVDNRANGPYDVMAKKMIDKLFSYAPFSQYQEYFSVYQVYANSVDAGADNQIAYGDHASGPMKNTIFNSTFWHQGIQRLLVMGDMAKVSEYISKANIPAGARRIVLGVVNSPVRGGSGGAIAVASCNEISPLTAVHEVGHMFSLADEYVDSGFANANGITPGHAAGKPNVTNDINNAPWKHFIGLPGYESEGMFEGGNYLLNGVWRPSMTSMMNRMDAGFNAISRETIVRKIFEWTTGETFDFTKFLARDNVRVVKASKSVGVPIDPDMMPVPWEYYVAPSDMPR